MEITATVTAASACAGAAGRASTVTAPPARSPASPKTGSFAAGEGAVCAASAFARTLEPRDPPANVVPPVAIPVTLNGAALNATCLQMARPEKTVLTNAN